MSEPGASSGLAHGVGRISPAVQLGFFNQKLVESWNKSPTEGFGYLSGCEVDGLNGFLGACFEPLQVKMESGPAATGARAASAASSLCCERTEWLLLAL